ncbi:MAG: GNAT family N-acetyltransferase [Nitrospirae bacterium]|nr:GNAT family N-acetyltransferase [Nitrospirota bacterium]
MKGFDAADGIHHAQGDRAVHACLAVMAELRPHLDRQAFADRVRALGVGGYRLAYLAAGGGIVTVAGYRVSENLAWGRFLYVDDLVTAGAHRGEGHGGSMLDWLLERAREEGCDALHLDSGVQRIDAHRFYEGHGLRQTSFHFAIGLE